MTSQQQQRIRGKYFGKKLKAKKVIELYKAGERDFQGAILRGQSFKGQDLSGADFSEADIRSTNFSDSNLQKIDFTGTKCGLQKRWATILVILSCLMAGVSGFFSIFTSVIVSPIFNSDLQHEALGWIGLLVLVIFLIVTINQGIITGAVAVAFGGAWIGIIGYVVAKEAVAKEAVAKEAVAIAGATAFGGAAAFAIAIAVVSASAHVFRLGVAAAYSGGAALAGAYTGAYLFALVVAPAVEFAGGYVLVGGAVPGLLGVYVGKRAIKGDIRDSWIRIFAIAFAAIGGTNFRGVDLTDANFSSARLKSTDFRKATLTQVRWLGAKMLDRARPGDTYLKDTQVRQWLIGEGKINNFNGKNLRDINLQGANLTNASFIGTDLGGANLNETILTGICIQDWNINTKTKFDDVFCDYIYLKEGNQERIPHDPDRNFKSGEFAKYIEKALNTVDLIFTDGIDWKAFFTSFQTLQEKYGAENIGFQAIERKSDDTFIVRIEVSSDANKAVIEGHSKRLYESNLKALEDKYRSKLNAKDREIALYKEKSADMKEIAKLLASRPINVEAKAVAENQSKNVEVEMNINAPSKGVVGKMTGDMNIYTSEQKQSITEVATEIVKLLDYFEQNDPSITEAQQIVKTATEEQPEILDAEIVEEAINSSPTLRQRLGAAGKAAYIETVKMLLPAFGIAYEAYQAYKNPES